MHHVSPSHHVVSRVRNRHGLIDFMVLDFIKSVYGEYTCIPKSEAVERHRPILTHMTQTQGIKNAT